MILKAFQSQLVDHLRHQGFEEPLMEAECLMAGVLGMGRAQLLARDQDQIPEESLRQLQSAQTRRLSGEPLAYILGYKDFFKARFAVGPGALIPRPETELLVMNVLREFPPSAEFAIADFGAGTGCIGYSVLLERPHSHLFAVEKSNEARFYLEKNRRELNLEKRTEIFNGAVEDINTRDLFDVIVANPPYIAPHDPSVMTSVDRFEPHEALYADLNGLGAIQRWAKIAATMLKPGSLFLMEIGSDQGEAMKKQAWVEWGFENPSIERDLAGLNRMVAVRRRRAIL